jgi:hypothetical protein
VTAEPLQDQDEKDHFEAEDDWEGDGDADDQTGLPLRARRVLAKILTSRFLTRANDKKAWEDLLAHESEIRERLADMFLVLEMDRELEVAFKRQDPREGVLKMLRKDKPLSRDASLLLVHLRKEYLFTDGSVQITREEVAEFLRPFRADGDGDDARVEARTKQAINALEDLRLLTKVAGADYLYQASPVIVPLVGSDELQRIERYFLDQAHGVDTTPEVGE